MQLSKFTDYSLRVLLLAASNTDRNTTIRDAAEVYGISHAHLKKVVLHLSRLNYLVAERGHGGGFRLGMPADQINLGDLIRSTETDFALVECYRPNTQCRIAACCLLPAILDEALAAFMAVMDRYTLQDLHLRGDAFALGSGSQTA
ncbi:MAG: Rrf2 family transcriptional regulator [Rhodobacteraceae bacterium]|nr:Rrf2 family transcriptional regulator [Paracoccaceae bacterium]